MLIKPDEFSQKIEDLKSYYVETYEMFDYLNKSRDDYISQNIELKKKITAFKRLFVYFFICFVIEFVLFLISVNI